MQFAPVLLLLALSMSWPRCAVIFRAAAGGGLSESPLTLLASAVSIASLALAIGELGPVTGSLLVLTAVLVSRALPTQASSAAVIASGVSLCVYLQLVGHAM